MSRTRQSGTPRPGKPSLRARMLAFFEANPHETLTAKDAAAKFNCTPRFASVTLSELKASGAVENAMVWRRSIPT